MNGTSKIYEDVRLRANCCHILAFSFNFANGKFWSTKSAITSVTNKHPQQEAQCSQLLSYSVSPGTETIWLWIFDASTIAGTMSLIVGAPSKRRFISNSSYRTQSEQKSWIVSKGQTFKICKALSTPSSPYDENAYRNGLPTPTTFVHQFLPQKPLSYIYSTHLLWPPTPQPWAHL